MARNLAAFFAGQVRELRTRVEILRIKRAPDRLLAWLRAAAKGEPPTVEQSSPWASVANEIGLTPEVVYRSLRKLEQTGQIERSGAVVIIRAAN
jgi:CRP-like cAMP-binding protein